MSLVYVEKIVGSVGDCEVGNSARCTARCTLVIVTHEAGERLHIGCRVREIDTELRTQDKVLYGRILGVKHAYSLVLLKVHRVVLEPLNGVVSAACPATVFRRSYRTVLVVGVPVREHKARSRNGSIESILAVVGLVNLLVCEHCVGTYLQMVVGLHVGIDTHIVAGERRTKGNTLLVEITGRHKIVELVGCVVNREVVALKLGSVVEHHIEPVYVGLAQYVIVLTCVEAKLFFELYALGSIHKIPVAVSKVGNTPLRTEGNIDLFGVCTALCGDNNHTVGSTGTVD